MICPRRALLFATGLLSWVMLPIHAADHLDTPLLEGAGNRAAQLADLYVFRNPDDMSQLVVGLTFNPLVPQGTTDVPFDEGVKYVINIDNQSAVDRNGNVLDPNGIKSRIRIEARAKNGEMQVKVHGARTEPSAIFVGLRDDPFIVSVINQNGFNVNALVVQLPLNDLLHENGSLLFWAHTKTRGFPNPFQESTAKPDTSTVLGTLGVLMSDSDFDRFNHTRPRQQLGQFRNVSPAVSGANLLPDVMLFRPELPDGFPNGRLLTDDIADIIEAQFLTPGVIDPDPGTTVNNVVFLNEFPYLAPPN